MLHQMITTVSKYLQKEVKHHIRHCYQAHHHFKHQQSVIVIRIQDVTIDKRFSFIYDLHWTCALFFSCGTVSDLRNIVLSRLSHHSRLLIRCVSVSCS